MLNPKNSLLSLALPIFSKVFQRQIAVIYGVCQPWQSSRIINFHAIAVPFGDNCGELKYALGALSYRAANEALPPQDAKTEFMEYCDGSWLAIDEIPNSELVQAA